MPTIADLERDFTDAKWKVRGLQEDVAEVEVKILAEEYLLSAVNPDAALRAELTKLNRTLGLTRTKLKNAELAQAKISADLAAARLEVEEQAKDEKDCAMRELVEEISNTLKFFHDDGVLDLCICQPKEIGSLMFTAGRENYVSAIELYRKLDQYAELKGDGEDGHQLPWSKPFRLLLAEIRGENVVEAAALIRADRAPQLPRATTTTNPSPRRRPAEHQEQPTDPFEGLLEANKCKPTGE